MFARVWSCTDLHLRAFKYDPSYPIRGLFLDKQTGNFLKVSLHTQHPPKHTDTHSHTDTTEHTVILPQVDNYGTISICVHGREKYEKSKIAELYPGTSDNENLDHCTPNASSGRQTHLIAIQFCGRILYAHTLGFRTARDRGAHRRPLLPHQHPLLRPRGCVSIAHMHLSLLLSCANLLRSYARIYCSIFWNGQSYVMCTTGESSLTQPSHSGAVRGPGGSVR